MPFSLSSVFGAALACCLAHTANAESKLAGVSFDIMPIGCRIHGSFSNGDTVTRDYMGKQGDTFIVKTYSGTAGTKLKMITTLNADGFTIRNDMPDGKWETYSPYSCLLEPGNCSFITRNSEGRQRTFKGKVTKEGTQLTTTGGFVGEDALPPSHAIMGRFNTMQSMSNGEISFQLTQYESCESN